MPNFDSHTSHDDQDDPIELVGHPHLTAALRRALVDFTATSSAERHDEVTDLPLPLCGNGGNHGPATPALQAAGVEDVLALLDEARASLPRPPLDDLRAAAVKEWIELVNECLLSRADRRRLAREAMRVLDDALRADLAAERLRERADHQEAIHKSKEDGTYWAVRDRRRKAQQPTHVEVDSDEWATFKARTLGRDRSLGEAAGYLVHAEVSRCKGRWQLPPLIDSRPGVSCLGRRGQLFARLVVSKQTWREFRGLAARRRITVARYVGLLVETELARVPHGGQPDA